MPEREGLFGGFFKGKKPNADRMQQAVERKPTAESMRALIESNPLAFYEQYFGDSVAAEDEAAVEHQIVQIAFVLEDNGKENGKGVMDLILKLDQASQLAGTDSKEREVLSKLADALRPKTKGVPQT